MVPLRASFLNSPARELGTLSLPHRWALFFGGQQSPALQFDCPAHSGQVGGIEDDAKRESMVGSRCANRRRLSCVLRLGRGQDRDSCPGADRTSRGPGDGDCHRCAWQMKAVEVNLDEFEEIDLLPTGTRGVLRGFMGSITGLVLSDTVDPSNSGATAFNTQRYYDVSFTNGLRFRNPQSGSPLIGTVTILYRLD